MRGLGSGQAVLPAGAIAIAALLGFAPGAAADLSFCPPGAGAGQCQNAGGVAVDTETGRVYVADSGNNRIDVFESDGTFVKAFGWGVADGAGEPQSCTAVCLKGIAGPGAGQLSAPPRLAVDNNPASASRHDLYVFESGNARVQKFGPEGGFLRMWGGDVVTGGAEGTGTVSDGSAVIASVATTKKAFLAGQTITGTDIQPATTISKVEAGALTLSKPAAGGACASPCVGEPLAVAAGTGNVPLNEKQTIKVTATAGSYKLKFTAPQPQSVALEQTTANIAFNASPNVGAESVQARLEALTNVGAGNVLVSEPSLHEYTVEFKGRYEDTNVALLSRQNGSPNLSGGSATLATATEGANALETCTEAAAAACKGGVLGSGECRFSGGADPNVAVGPAGAVYVADSAEQPGGTFKTRIERFEPSGACAGEAALNPEETHRAKAIAVDSAGNAYIPFTVVGGIRKYDPAGVELYSRDLGVETNALAIGEADELFAAQRENRDEATLGSFNVITEYSPGGAQLRRFGYGKLQSAPPGIAAHHSADGDVFAGQGSGVSYLAFPPAGPIAPPGTLETKEVGNTKATLVAEVNPEGKETHYQFKYVDLHSYETEGGFASPKTKSAPPATAPAGAEDFELHTVKAEIGCAEPTPALIAEGKCLAPSTKYRFEVVATNTEGPGEGTTLGPDFTTKPPLEIKAAWATEVGTDTAAVHAEVNPLGIPTSGWFEYVDDATFQADFETYFEAHEAECLEPAHEAECLGHGFDHATKAPDVPGEAPLEFGSGKAPLAREALLFPLAPATVYHYRAVATDPLLAEPVDGPEHAFATFAEPGGAEGCPANEALRAGPSARLPDCRAYELVSPLEKGNGDIVALDEPTQPLPATLDQSAASGGKLAYGTYQAFGEALAAPYTSQYIATRGGEGWRSEAISPPRGRALLSVAGSLDTEYKAFSPDLCEGWLRTVAEPALAPAAAAGSPNIYRRQNCGGGGYEALTTVAPPNAPGEAYFPLELLGAAAGGEAAIYLANDDLSPEAPPQPPGCEAGESFKCEFRLYYQRAGEGPPDFVCVLPGGEALKAPCAAGTPNKEAAGKHRYASVQNAISADGSRVFWTASPLGNGTAGRLYVRENPGQPESAAKDGAGDCVPEAERACTVAVSRGAEELSGTSKSQFWSAARDGSKAIFSSGEDLYEFAVDSKATHPIAHKVSGVAGASEDASRVYLVSEEACGGPNAEGRSPTPNKPNLYLYETGESCGAGELAFVATLAGDQADIAPLPIEHSTRVSPDGSRLAFVSFASPGPTGYDNLDASSGTPDAEAYLYDAGANGGAGKLLCASCDPSGARPAGSALIPAWENDLYASRALSENGGRLYFQSPDALVNADTNGATDVYQWEAAGEGSCREGTPAYSPANGGCLSLISSGKSPGDSEFLDADPSGENVFFATSSSLVAQDYGLADIYDARAGGGLPAPQGPPAQCEGEACQNPPGAPEDPTPASSSGGGAANLHETAKKRRKPHRRHRKKHRSGAHAKRRGRR